MKMSFRSKISGLLCFALGMAKAATGAAPLPIHYEVGFKGAVVATQTVAIVESAGFTTVSTSFAAELPVFIALHQYSEKLSATFRADGTVERLGAIRLDGGAVIGVAGTLQEDGRLRVVRTDLNGVFTNYIAREDYDFNSLILFGTSPARFLPTNRPARILSVAEGRIIPTDIQTISESDTFERQNLASQHLIWTEGIHTSHSWHPEHFSNLPRRYIRQTENGEFTFNLLR
jgi:hypothetical protein